MHTGDRLHGQLFASGTWGDGLIMGEIKVKYEEGGWTFNIMALLQNLI